MASTVEAIWQATGHSPAECELALLEILRGHCSGDEDEELKGLLQRYFKRPAGKAAELAEESALDELMEQVRAFERLALMRDWRGVRGIAEDMENIFNMSARECLALAAEIRGSLIATKSEMPFKAWALAVGKDKAFKKTLREFMGWGARAEDAILEGREPAGEVPRGALYIFREYCDKCAEVKARPQELMDAISAYNAPALRYLFLLNYGEH